MVVKRHHPYLMSGLLEGWDWFDIGLQNMLRDGGFPSLNKTQTMMVLYISAGVQRPIEIARRMRLSRQAIRHIETQLVKRRMITARADPTDKRSKILAFAPQTTRVRKLAERGIKRLEAELKSRIGARNFAAMQSLLDLDWGECVHGEAVSPGRRRRLLPAR